MKHWKSVFKFDNLTLFLYLFLFFNISLYLFIRASVCLHGYFPVSYFLNRFTHLVELGEFLQRPWQDPSSQKLKEQMKPTKVIKTKATKWTIIFNWRKLDFSGHVSWHDTLSKTVLRGTLEGKPEEFRAYEHQDLVTITQNRQEYGTC